MRRFRVGSAPKIACYPEKGEMPCQAEKNGWLCTRKVGHEGKHQAGGLSRHVHAEWS